MLRHFLLSFMSLLGGFATTATFAQNPPSAESSASSQRHPFASPGTPRLTERIRDVDIKHIKAELTLDAKSMRPDYLRSLAAFRDRYKADCSRVGIDYVPVDTSINFDKALMEYLLQRKRRF